MFRYVLLFSNTLWKLSKRRLSENSAKASSPKALWKVCKNRLSESSPEAGSLAGVPSTSATLGDGDSEDDNVHEIQVDGDEEGEVVKQDRRFIEGGLISNNLVGITSTGIYAAFLQKCKTLILPNNRNLDRANIWEHKSQAAAALQWGSVNRICKFTSPKAFLKTANFPLKRIAKAFWKLGLDILITFMCQWQMSGTILFEQKLVYLAKI